MTTPTFIKSFAATGAIAPYTIAAFAADGKVQPATAATDRLAGAVDSMGAAAPGQMADIVQGGWGEVQLGGTVAAGDPITADANGKGVKLTPTAGATKFGIGTAQKPGVAGDIIPYLAAPIVMAMA